MEPSFDIRFYSISKCSLQNSMASPHKIRSTDLAQMDKRCIVFKPLAWLSYTQLLLQISKLKSNQMKFYGIFKGGEKQRWRRNDENNFCSWEEVFCANPEFRVIFFWPHSKLFQVQASNGSADTAPSEALQTGWYSKRGWNHSLSYTMHPFFSNSTSYFGYCSYNNMLNWWKNHHFPKLYFDILFI